MKIHLLSLLIAAALTAGSAQAGTATVPPTPAQQEAARAEIARLSERIRELSKQLGENTNVRVITQRIDGSAPGAIRIERESEAFFPPGPGLGIVMAPNPAANGVRIVAVSPDSPASKAGLHSGDVLMSINDQKISGSGTAAVEHARALIGKPEQGQTVKLVYAREGKTFTADVKAEPIKRMMMINIEGDGAIPGMEGQHREHWTMMMPPNVEMDIERFGPMRECPPGEKDCDLPAFFQAFRWQGLNLASVDAALGRYFGTDHGVLVLSSGPELKGLQAGDVIQGIAGKPVKSPRDVMSVLREKDAGSQVKLELLRDRKTMTVSVTVPEARALPFMMPPAPPAPPVPPVPPRAPSVAPPAPATPPPPPPPMPAPAAKAAIVPDAAIREMRPVGPIEAEQAVEIVLVQEG